MEDKVNELVERKANAIGFHLLDTGVYDHAEDASKIARELAVIALDDSDLALIDPVCTATLKWTKCKLEVDSRCDYWDCPQKVKAGEIGYIEDYGDGHCQLYCTECASFFMAQKLSYIIPLAEALKEVK